MITSLLIERSNYEGGSTRLFYICQNTSGILYYFLGATMCMDMCPYMIANHVTKKKKKKYLGQEGVAL